MKVLFVAPYIYKKEYPEFTRNLTGFGLMVEDIFEEVSKTEDVSLFSLVITEGHGSILKHTWGDVFGKAKIKDYAFGLKNFCSHNQGLKNRCRDFYYGLNNGAFRKAINTVNPDVVHIHGLGSLTRGFIDVCEEMKVPFVVTLHGLIGLDDSIKAPVWDKRYEKEFLNYADSNGIVVTVISTGIKRRIEKEYLGRTSKFIRVVCNGTNVSVNDNQDQSQIIDLREKYKLEDNEKIVVVIGSLCERKNQEQIVRAFAAGKVTAPCRVFFCGNDVTDGKIDRIITENGLKDKLYLLGFVPKSTVSGILDQADLNVVASRDEGFGLSIIEAYVHGVPTVTFEDLDAVPDLFDEKGMLTVSTRNDADLANGIESALEVDWDRDYIRSMSQKFSLERMKEGYVLAYKEACGLNNR